VGRFPEEHAADVCLEGRPTSSGIRKRWFIIAGLIIRQIMKFTSACTEEARKSAVSKCMVARFPHASRRKSAIFSSALSGNRLYVKLGTAQVQVRIFTVRVARKACPVILISGAEQGWPILGISILAMSDSEAGRFKVITLVLQETMKT